MARIELSNIGGGGGTTLSLTTTGTSGAATLAGSVLNIPIYQGALTLTTTGTSGAATLVGDTLNIPNYATGGTPAGSAGEVQFNSTPSGSFAASSNFAWDDTNVRLNIGAPSSPTGTIDVKGSGSTASTVTLRLTNSSNTELFKVLDTGSTNIGTGFNWDNVNGRLGIGAAAATVPLFVNGIISCTSVSQTTSTSTVYSFSGGNLTMSASGTQGARLSQHGFFVGSANVNPASGQNCLIRGRTAASGASALIVQNSTPFDLYKIDNDGKITYWANDPSTVGTGAVTINRPSGYVKFAAGASSLVVTNSLCTTSSIVLPVVRTNDATATIKNVVPGSGSFTINLNAAASAETSVGFFIIN